MKKYLYFVIAAFIAIYFFLPSFCIARKVEIQKLKQNKLQSSEINNAGTEFSFTVPPMLIDSNQNDSVRIFITSTVATNCVLEIPSRGIYLSKVTIPNGIIEFGLEAAAACCYLKGRTDKNKAEAVYPGYGIHVYADDPIMVYGSTYPTGDTWLWIPTAALGIQYIVASYDDMTQSLPGERLPSLSCCTGTLMAQL